MCRRSEGHAWRPVRRAVSPARQTLVAYARLFAKRKAGISINSPTGTHSPDNRQQCIFHTQTHTHTRVTKFVNKTTNQPNISYATCRQPPDLPGQLSALTFTHNLIKNLVRRIAIVQNRIARVVADIETLRARPELLLRIVHRRRDQRHVARGRRLVPLARPQVRLLAEVLEHALQRCFR